MTDVRTNSRVIAALNDYSRQTFYRCLPVLSEAVMNLPEADRIAIMNKVITFRDFTPDNDPYGEHDFGMVEHEGEKYFWKFDYYDKDMEFGSPDPSDPSVTTRVLTIFLSSEY